MRVRTVCRTVLSHSGNEILVENAYCSLLESSRTRFQSPLVREVSFLCSVIWSQGMWVRTIFLLYYLIPGKIYSYIHKNRIFCSAGK